MRVPTLRTAGFCADQPGLRHHGGGLIQQLGLMICVKGSSISHVVQNITAYESIPEDTETGSHGRNWAFLSLQNSRRVLCFIPCGVKRPGQRQVWLMALDWLKRF